LAAWKLTVIAASTATPSTSPLEASTPEATSQATTAASQRLIASIAAAAGCRGAPEKPVPKIASTTAPEPARRRSSSAASRGDPALLDRPAVDGAHPRGVVERSQPGLHHEAD
jgi:hypothetical protein